MRSIDLAHEPPMSIGDLELFPPTHEVRRGAQREIIEPRVMQVLIALAQADGAVLTRDELILRCWDGRIVGDDAIHRVLSRLRRLSEGIAEGVFRVETITKVGYRLVRPDSEELPHAAPGRPAEGTVANRFDRRTMIVAAGAAAVVGGGALWLGTAPQEEQAPT